MEFFVVSTRQGPSAALQFRLHQLRIGHRRLFLHAKNNLAEPPQGLAFRLGTAVEEYRAQRACHGGARSASSHWDHNPEKPRADLNRPWRAIAKCAALEDVRIHDLRHTHASIGAGAGLGLPIIGKLLGHSQLSTTARYAHLDANPLRSASEAIGSRIDGRGTPTEPEKCCP
jgi:integrase